MSPRERALAAALIACITAVQWWALARGHDWGDDFAVYVSHARNLVEGRDYSDIGYIFNAQYPQVGPRNYPPVTPLLLTLPYRAFGLDLYAMKCFFVLLCSAFLAAFYALVRPALGPGPGLPLALLGVVGLSPALLLMERSVGSEIPFLVFLYFAFWLFARLDRQPPGSTGARVALAVAFGLVLYLCYGTRSVGLALIPALVAHDLLRYRRLRSTSWIALGVFLPCAILEAHALHSLQDYGTSVGNDLPANRVLGLLRNVARAARRFPVFLTWAWRGELPFAFEAPFTALLFALAALGFASSVRRGPSLPDLFAVVYLGMLAVLPPFGGDLRRLVPVLPLFFFYVFQGVLAAPGLSKPPRRRWLAAVVVLGLAISYADLAARTEWGPPKDGIQQASAQELFQFVRSEAAGHGACVFVKPRALALYAGCPSAVYHLTGDLDSLDRFFVSIGANWFIVTRKLGPEDPLARWVQARGERLQPVFENPDFQVYRRRSDAPPQPG